MLLPSSIFVGVVMKFDLVSDELFFCFAWLSHFSRWRLVRHILSCLQWYFQRGSVPPRLSGL